MKILFCTFLFLIANLSFADNLFVLIGGGGDPKGEKTIFDNSISEINMTLGKNKNWNKVACMDGGHSNTVKLIESLNATNDKCEFTQKNYDLMVQSLIEKIKKNEIKPGEKLLIQIDSHGAVRSKKSNQLTHGIADIDGELVSLDSLKDLTDVALENGVQLGIVDLSCHSGAILALNTQNPNLCLISGSSDENFSYTDFSYLFNQELQPGTSLEDAFLKARSVTTSKSYPMINSEVGVLVQNITEEMHKMLFDNTNDPIGNSSNKIEAYIDAQIELNGKCNEIPIPKTLLDTIDKATELSTVVKRFLMFTIVEKKEFKELRDLLENRKKILNEARVIRASVKEMIEKKEVLDPPKEHISFTWGELMNMNYNKWLIEQQDRLSITNDEEVKKEIEDKIIFYNRMKEAHERIKATPEYGEIQASNNLLNQKYEMIGSLSSVIATKERDLYNTLYTELNNARKSSKDLGCKAFKI